MVLQSKCFCSQYYLHGITLLSTNQHQPPCVEVSMIEIWQSYFLTGWVPIENRGYTLFMSIFNVNKGLPWKISEIKKITKSKYSNNCSKLMIWWLLSQFLKGWLIVKVLCFIILNVRCLKKWLDHDTNF